MVMFSTVCCLLHVLHEWQSNKQVTPVRKIIEEHKYLISLFLIKMNTKFDGDKNNYLFDNIQK